MRPRSPCIGWRYNGSAQVDYLKRPMAPRRAQRHEHYSLADWLRSIADRWTPAAILTASADILPKAIIPAAPTDIVALARSPIAARSYRVIAWSRIGTGDAKAEHGADGHTSG